VGIFAGIVLLFQSPVNLSVSQARFWPPVSASKNSVPQIQRLEGVPLRARTVLLFGIEAIDARLLSGGVALGALHEVADGGNAAIDGAVAALFAAGIAARTKGKVLWWITRQDLFAPRLGPGRSRP
jgi:protein ImuA